MKPNLNVSIIKTNLLMLVATKWAQKLMLLFLAFLLSGCAASKVALIHRKLDVQTKMSNTVFLDLEKQTARSVFVDVKNTSDKNLELDSLLRQQLQTKGYVLASAPADAFYILQVNVLYLGEANRAAIEDSVDDGWGGGTLAGGAAGVLIGAATDGLGGAIGGGAIGAFAGGTAEFVSGALVKNVTFTLMTDVQISERTDEKVEQSINSNLAQGTGTAIQQTSHSTRDRRKYQTRIASTANKVNLKFEKALPQLQEGLTKSIAGIF